MLIPWMACYNGMKRRPHSILRCRCLSRQYHTALTSEAVSHVAVHTCSSATIHHNTPHHTPHTTHTTTGSSPSPLQLGIIALRVPQHACSPSSSAKPATEPHISASKLHSSSSSSNTSFSNPAISSQRESPTPSTSVVAFKNAYHHPSEGGYPSSAHDVPHQQKKQKEKRTTPSVHPSITTSSRQTCTVKQAHGKTPGFGPRPPDNIPQPFKSVPSSRAK